MLDRYSIAASPNTIPGRRSFAYNNNNNANVVDDDIGSVVSKASSKGTNVSEERCIRDKELQNLRSKKLAKCLREQFEHNGK